MFDEIDIANRSFNFNRLSAGLHNFFDTVHGGCEAFAIGKKRNVSNDKLISRTSSYGCCVNRHHGRAGIERG